MQSTGRSAPGGEADENDAKAEVAHLGTSRIWREMPGRYAPDLWGVGHGYAGRAMDSKAVLGAPARLVRAGRSPAGHGFVREDGGFGLGGEGVFGFGCWEARC